MTPVKRLADKELQLRRQLEKNYENTLDNGAIVRVHITMETSEVSPEQTEKILSEFAKCSRRFYLEAGKKLNNTP